MKLNYEKAKKIFNEYAGSEFQMQREGVLKKYKSFNIPLEVENNWRKEYADRIKSNIYTAKTNSERLEAITDYIDVVKRLFNSSVTELIDDFMQNIEKMDSYTEIRLIELKLNEIKGDRINQEQIIEKCVKNLHDLERKELTVDRSYYDDGKLPEYLSNDKLYMRIDNLIKYWKCK